MLIIIFLRFYCVWSCSRCWNWSKVGFILSLTKRLILSHKMFFHSISSVLLATALASGFAIAALTQCFFHVSGKIFFPLEFYMMTRNEFTNNINDKFVFIYILEFPIVYLYSTFRSLYYNENSI